VFSTRKATTSVSVYDGQTVVLAGLMREDVQKTEDKTPIIGDIPFVGRAFRTNVDQHIKKNLIIFVAARVITPFGLAFNNEEEEEEGCYRQLYPKCRRIRSDANHELTLIDTNQRGRTTDCTNYVKKSKSDAESQIYGSVSRPISTL
jgi:type II secretory pathway component GspD/PulD (secretin)